MPHRPQTMGEALRMLRHRVGLSRDALAERVGASAGAISNYENDVSAPSAATLRRIVHVLSELLDHDRDELWRDFGDLLDRDIAEA